MTLDSHLWESPAELMAKFDLNGDGVIGFDEFKALCGELFGPKEVEENEYRIRDIFDVMDSDGDSVLSPEEWDRCYKEWMLVVLKPVNVLLVVDVQNDFIDGSMALRDCNGQDGAEVVEVINRLLTTVHWDKVIYSQDWHPENHIGFHENLHLRELHPDSKISKEEARPFDTVLFLNPNLEQRLWPKHCVINSWGAQLHKDLIVLPGSDQVRKGQNPDMETYSVFLDNNKVNSTELQDILSDIAATDIYVCGLAYDVCVSATCLDGLRLGYRLACIDDCCRGVDLKDIAQTRKAIVENGGLVTESKDVPLYVNGEKRSLVMAQQAACALAKKWLSNGKEDEDVTRG